MASIISTKGKLSLTKRDEDDENKVVSQKGKLSLTPIKTQTSAEEKEEATVANKATVAPVLSASKPFMTTNAKGYQAVIKEDGTPSPQRSAVQSVGQSLIAQGGVNQWLQNQQEKQQIEASALDKKILQAEKDTTSARQDALSAMHDEYMSASRGYGTSFLNNLTERTEDAIQAYQEEVQNLLDLYAERRLESRAELAKQQAEEEQKMRIAADEQRKPDSLVSSMRESAQANKEKDWSGTNPAHVLPYLLGETAQGAADQVWNIRGGVSQTLGDLFTGGRVSNSAQKIQTYFDENPESYAQFKAVSVNYPEARGAVLADLARKAGVSAGDMEVFRQNNLARTDRENMQNTLDVSEGVRDVFGNLAFTAGQQLPSLLLTSGGSGTLVAPAIQKALGAKAPKLAQTVIKLAGGTEATLESVLARAIMGAGAYGSTLQENARKYGYDLGNYASAAANAMIESATEVLGNTSTIESILRTDFAQASLGEMLEEFIGYPVSKVADWLVLKEGRRSNQDFSEIFDMNEWITASASGLALGSILGSVGSIGNIAGRTMEGKMNLNQAVADANAIAQRLPENLRPAPLDYRNATKENVRDYLSKVMDAQLTLAEQMKSGAQTSEAQAQTSLNQAQTSLNQAQTRLNQAQTRPIQGFTQETVQTQAGQQQSAQRPAAQLPQANEVRQEENKLPADVSRRAQMMGGIDNAETRRLSDGNTGRISGERTGGQAGGMGESAANAQRQAAEQRRKANDRRSKAEAVQLEKISSQALGLNNGTDDEAFSIYTEELWDDELRQIATEAKEKYGVDITYTIGAIPVRKTNGEVTTVRGVWTTDGRMIVQADTNVVDTVRVMEHEGWHSQELSPKQLREIETKIRTQYDANEFDRIADKYIKKLRGVVDITEGMSDAAYQAAYTRILDEIFANANAGINAFGANVTQYQQTVQQEAERMAPGNQTAQATDRTTGPPQTNAEEIAEVMRGLQADLEAGNITQEQFDAVQQGFDSYSMSEEEKQQRLGDLRSYLAGNMSKQELDRKIESRTTQRQQTGVTMSRDAQNIKKAAARQGISVEEYLRQNWELFDVDGEWNQAAREALDSERGTSGRTEMYSISETLEEDLEKVKNNTFNAASGEVYVGETSQFLVDEIGAKKLAVTMPSSKAYSAIATEQEAIAASRFDDDTNYHGLGVQGLIEVLEASENPVAAFVSAKTDEDSRFDRIVLVTDKTKAGKNVVVVQEVDSKSRLQNRRIKTNKIVTAYEREALLSDIVRAANENRLLKFDKKRSQTLAGGLGSNSLAAIQSVDFEKNIQHFWNNVKWKKSGAASFYADGGEEVKTPMQMAFEKAGYKSEDSYSLDEEAEAQEEAETQTKETTEQKPKEKKPKEESKPITAKKDLRNNLLNLFSIPDEMRGNLGAVIDNYADRLLKNGSLTEEDLNQLIDRLYAEGVMWLPVNEYYQYGRQAVQRGRIYVSPMEKEEFGSDWNAFRKRAFAAGVWLTNDRGDSGVDVWNMELAEIVPGLFSSNDTDSRMILENIVQMAQSGKEEKVSLAEYAHQMAEREYVSEDELLDNLERQVDWALKTFAEKAELEVKLRDRYDVKAFSQYKQEYREREMIRKAAERDRRKEMAQRAKENRELKEMQQKTLKQLQWLSKNRFRAPEELKATWDEVLGDIDIYAVGAANEARYSEKYNATWKDLAQMYAEARDNDPNFIPSADLERIVSRLNDKKIADLDIDALQNLYRAAVGLRTEFYNRNNVINDEKNRLFAEVYTDSKTEIETAPGGYTGKWRDKYMNLDQLTPMNVMERMVGWNPDSTFYSMAKQLEQGERDMRDYEVRANRLLEDFLTKNAEWVKQSDGQGKNAKWYELKVHPLTELKHGDAPIFSDETVTVYMTPAQKVHMYLESKNTQNLRHMMGGRTFVDKKLYSDGKRQEAFAKGTTVRLAPETVKQIVSDLTEQEMQLAKLLEDYYNNFATERINKVSNVLNGYDKAMAGNYAPIFTNNNYTKQEFGKFDATAEGVSNLKTRIPFASNPSYNISALDAFERNVGQTARYVGMAIPARNWTNFMSWRTENNSTSDVITHKWGQEAKDYIGNLIADLQAGKSIEKESASELADKIMSQYISATFGANPSIVLKQLGSLPMATVYLDAKNIPTPAQLANIKKSRDLINKYTSELAWRTMGYTTPETKQLKDNPNWTETNKFTRFTFGGGAITAMDGAAASVLWPWAENKVRREQQDLEVGTQEQIDAGQSPFYQAVAKEFNEALVRSQSVSDQMHQGTLRKSTNLVARTITMFKSDASQVYNAMRQKIGEAKYYKRIGADPKVIKEAHRKVGSVFVNAVGGYSWAALVSFLVALLKNKGKYYRDDEGELTAESVAQEMAIDLVGSIAGVVPMGQEIVELIGSKLTNDTWFGIEAPGIEQIADIMEMGAETGDLAMEIIKDSFNVAQNGGSVGKYIESRAGDILGAVKDIAIAASTYISGVPVKNVEAYLAGTLSWVAPGFAKKYESVFKQDVKSGLKGLKGKELSAKISSILDERGVDVQSETADLLAELYETEHGSVVPSNTPTSVSIDSVEHVLDAYQTQTYEMVWGAVVADVLEPMMQTGVFQNADPATQEKILKGLYDYAAADAKDVVFEQYVPDKWVGYVKEAMQAGLDEATALAYRAAINAIEYDENLTSYEQGVKARELITDSGLSDEEKMAIFEMAYKGTAESRVEKFKEMMADGMSWADIALAYDKYAELDANEELSASQKATEFAYWINRTGFTQKEENAIEEQLGFWSMSKSEPTRFDKFSDAGLDDDTARELTKALAALEPLEGKKGVSAAQEYKAIADERLSDADTLAAFGTIMGEKELKRVTTGYDMAVSPKVYANVKYSLSQFDEDGSGSYSQEEIEEAIDAYAKQYRHLNNGDKAILWQMLTGSTSTKNNPYSKSVARDYLERLEE